MLVVQYVKNTQYINLVRVVTHSEVHVELSIIQWFALPSKALLNDNLDASPMGVNWE